MRRSRLTAFAAGGLSAAGLPVGHWLAYAAAHPAAPTRHAALAPAHGWLPAVQEAVPLLAVIAAATIVLRRVTRRNDDGPTDRIRLARGLATIQVAAFVTLEIGERLAAGGWADLPVVLVVGAAAQVVTAWLVAIVLGHLSSLGTMLGDAVARAARAPTTSRTAVLTPAPSAASLRVAGRSFAIRAPPSRA